ncbi:MAG TPA: helix-turn-helix domain-containing protein [Patescibacteria group bacterium]|nr:helix-turn-helix domain-containing protein [Patescibacteria group bacterium]
MEEKITRILSRFGFNESEIMIYLTVLKLDKPTVTEIAKKADLQRTLVYFHLKTLLKRDVVRELVKGKIKRFVATPPKELAERFQRWTTDVYSIVPELESLQTIDEQTPIVTIHDFATAHYEHYNELASLSEGSEFRVIQSKQSADPDFQAFKPGEWKQIVERMIERNIMTRAIFTDEMVDTAHTQMDAETYAVFKQRNWQIRAIPQDRFDFEEMMIHQDKVTFLLTDIGILVRIQHKRIARAMIALFDALWLTGKTRKFE